MGTVNDAELLILARDRQPKAFDDVGEMIGSSPIRLVPPTAHQAEIAATARLRYRLNLGDCFACALAREEHSSLLTLDRDFRRTDVAAILPR